MATYSEVKVGLDEISAKNNRARALIEISRRQLADAEKLVDDMPQTYSMLITELNSIYATDQNNPAFSAAWSEKNELVKDFQALKTYIVALIAAFDNAAG